LGPYLYKDVAVPLYSHNPQIVVDRSGSSPVYLIYHIGGGSGGNAKNCATFRSSQSHPSIQELLAGGLIHYATSPDGPWEGVSPSGLGNCNNPAPYLDKNGTVLLVCTHASYIAASWKGPYTLVNNTNSGNGGKGTWEDPFIWLDKRNMWKQIGHVYAGTGEHYADRVAGYAYSRDGRDWVRCPTPPWDNKVTQTDGKTIAYTTRERPKIFFDTDGFTMKALFTGVAGTPGGNKDLCGEDWTFNLAQPIG